MSRFNTRPARKAPRIPSIPTNSISPAPKKTIARTKMNCITLSLYRWKNQRPTRGKTQMINVPRKMTFITSQIQNSPPVSPLNSPPTTARINSVSVSVTAVPPTAILTLRWRDTPKRVTMGQATRVCDAYILASSTEVITPYFRYDTFATNPIPMGTIKASNPSTNALFRVSLKSPIFISRPARNMM